MKNPTGYGACWYEREDYDEMRLLLKNPANMPLAYDDWLLLYKNSLEVVKKRGQIAIPIKIKAPQFTAWCLRNNRKIEANALRDFLGLEALRISNSGG